MIPQNSPLTQKILWNDKVLFKQVESQTDLDHIVNKDEQLKFKVETILGFPINNVYIFKEALIHKSAQKYYRCSNERLEFLGDAIINTSVAHYLFMTYTNSDEGFLTKLRTKLVNKHSLCYLARQTHLNEIIVTSKQIAINDKILEDAFEAFVGALYLDKGFDVTQKFVIELMQNHINFEEILVDNNFKDILLRYSQKQFTTLPEYVLNANEGPAHKRMFYVSVYINGDHYGDGEGSTKKNAEQMAAKVTLEQLNVNLKDCISSKA